MAEHAAATLQENLLTLLIFDEANGQLVHNLVDVEHFHGEYRTIAERCYNYRDTYGAAPGREHIYDLLADILEDKNNSKRGVLLQTLDAMQRLSEGINTTYVLDQANAFVRQQTISRAILKSAQLLQQRREDSITDIEAIWSSLLRVDSVGFDPGLRLGDTERIINFLNERYVEFDTGIAAFDANGIVPYRDAVFLFLAATGMGKSWWLIQLGKRALLRRKKVLHITLEMSEEEVASRYFQSLFSVSKRSGDVSVTSLELNTRDRLSGFEISEIAPEFSFDSKILDEELKIHMRTFGPRLENLVIKKFPTRGLTPDGLRRYLDTLERVTKFTPDLLLLDYLGLMKTDAKDHRIALGRNFEDVRGIAGERHMAVGTAHQVSRAGAQQRMASSTDVAEDWSLIGTADRVVTYSATDQERRYGLARLFVDKARSDLDKFGVLITQKYGLGQFVLDSVRMDNKYWDILKELSGNQDSSNSDDEVEDDDS
jgi:hypothetical protein